jgi:hypothetical protein
MAIPTPIIRNLEQNGILRTMAIDLSDKVEDRAAIIEVLRSKLYSDKILAPIREYSTNAVDSHVEAGIPNIPIKVTLPTQISPEFRIRDYGNGLTEEEFEEIFIKYGRSTKRGTNSQTGQLGLGCKSAFAYGDNFVVVSLKDGVKTTYNLTINGVCTIIAVEQMEPDEQTGVEVIIPVDNIDIKSFQNKSIQFFKYWKICPDIRGGDVGQIESLRNELAVKPLFCGSDWQVRPVHEYRYNGEDGIALMGNIPYPINWNIISQKLNLGYDKKNDVLFQFVRSNKTIFHFNIGELDFSASRESLEYTEKTCKVILEKVQCIFDNIFDILDDKIKSAPSYWNALIIYNQIFGRYEEAMFQGDIHRLETYYKNKFSWNNIPIQGGCIYGVSRWDTALGYSETGLWEGKDGHNPVLTVYENKNGRIKKYNQNDIDYRIPASDKIQIMIYDVEKVSMIKASVRHIMFETTGKRANKVYLLRFKDADQQKDYFEKTHFESVPVIYASSIIEPIKVTRKLNRENAKKGMPATSTVVREFQPFRYYRPTSRIDDCGCYRETPLEQQIDLDIREEEGFYITSFDGKVRVNGNTVNNVGALAHHTHVLLNLIGESIDRVYVIPERLTNAKWFDSAIEDGQWNNIETYFSENKNLFVQGKKELILNTRNYYSSSVDITNSRIGIDFANRLLPILNDKTGEMYKVCSKISPEFRKTTEIVNALMYFNISDVFSKNSETDFVKMFSSVRTKYPMIYQLSSLPTIQSNNKYNPISTPILNTVANYVNMVDKMNSVV